MAQPLFRQTLLFPRVQQRLPREQRAHDEDRGRKINEAEVADRVESPRVVRRQRNSEADHRAHDRGDPRPPVPAADAVPRARGDRDSRCGDEAGDRDMEMADVWYTSGLNAWIASLSLSTCPAPIPSSRKLSVKFRKKKMTA